MKSFKCFKDYSDDLLFLFERFEKTYYAHRSCDNKEKELLSEHSKLVSDYFLQLVNVHGIENLLDSAIIQLFENLDIENKTEWGNLLKEIFYAVIIYHDLGKVNPNFQVAKMENNSFSSNKKLSIQSNHSLLGAYVYSNIFFEKIYQYEKLNEKEKLYLYFIVLLFASTIIEHHSPIINLKLEYEENQLDDCFLFLRQTFCILLEENFCKSFFMEANNIFGNVKELIFEKRDVYFFLFSIAKLLYSLLTASDFYATNQFMSKTKIEDFGILKKNEQETLINRFKTVKPYNKDLYLNLDYYCSFPFENLEKRSNQNLNILRQKLTAEMIVNLRNNTNKHCFYIEAPTGAGKTNLSLAFATELLHIDDSLNKIFYVFPFTTLITQTYYSIRETLEIDNNSIIQLHSKVGFHEKQDGSYGNEKQLYIDNLFVNYPIAVMSHIHFFDILKSNEKESNYLIHRLCNSIVIIDEIQTYNPEHWDKIVFFLAKYAQLLNIRVLIMSATLPKIDTLHEELDGMFASLISNRDDYFMNNNFSGRVSFDFSLMTLKKQNDEKTECLTNLSNFLIEKANQYALVNENKVKVLIEFITKKTASNFFQIIVNKELNDYKIMLLSGDILEFRRKEIIAFIKKEQYPKIIIVSTQVIEAGVDIDMDIGFKDHSLIDSDEQLAGRINRNALKNNCVVYLFDYDRTATIYGTDERYKVQQTDNEIFQNYEDILRGKKFHSLYEKIFARKKEQIKSKLFSSGHYYQNLVDLHFSRLHSEFKLIDNNNSQQLFIPILIPVSSFEKYSYLEEIKVLTTNKKYVDGEKVFCFYDNLIRGNSNEFFTRKIELKRLGGVISQFCISVSDKQLEAISDMLDIERNRYGYKYLLHWKDCYSPEYGFDSEKINTSVFL
ncbi:Reverse gyrase [termite gut metagenome]|uniref:Reverse gyrase n=1 Tax=termite gut metagenome TaxID=433724 RepID=A0A5J4REJ2_9ZZZZ